MSPLISVLIPTYNYGHFLEEALESVLNQTFTDYEVIVVDDGSTDHTKKIVQKFPVVRYIYQEHGGISKARNAAIKEAKGRWIAFLDADDSWQKDKLKKQIDYIQQHPGSRIIYTKCKNFTEIPEEQMTSRQKEILQSDIKWCMVSALIDAKLFVEYGLFDENMEYSEDTEWTFRLKFSKVDLEACLDEELYFRRVHETNTTASHREFYRKDICKYAIDAYRKAKKLSHK